MVSAGEGFPESLRLCGSWPVLIVWHLQVAQALVEP